MTLNKVKAKRDPFLLVELAQKGSEEAYEELYNQYFTPIYRYVFVSVRSREETEDLTQTVFIKIFDNLDKVKRIGKSPAAYFFKIARNLIIDYLKKKKDLIPDEADYLSRKVDTKTDFLNELNKKDEIGNLIKMLDSLSESQREVIELKFIKDLNNKEIAYITGKNEAAIRKIQSRAILKLRDKLNNHEFKI
ncbi:MAG: sigma-70 family RNA polymerase sigma factor [Candidatus Moranbacteria bacterium]|nr:sigma-70 family RNA polymerase sigma factor [Candidatus Moranbacteria bacterium]